MAECFIDCRAGFTLGIFFWLFGFCGRGPSGSVAAAASFTGAAGASPGCPPARSAAAPDAVSGKVEPGGFFRLDFAARLDSTIAGR